MTNIPKTSKDQLSEIWDAACKQYGETTGLGLADPKFPRLDRTEDLFSQLEAEKEHFADFRKKKRSLFHAVQAIVAPFEVLGNLVATIIAPAFPPAPSVMGAILLLIQAARGVSVAFDSIMDLFDEIGDFTKRLDIYKKVVLSVGMKEIIVRVMTIIMNVCAVSQNLIRQGFIKSRMKRFAKNLFSEDKKISTYMSMLRDLTSKEHKMATAQTLMEGQEMRKELQDMRLDVREDTGEILRMLQVDHSGKHYQDLLERVKTFLTPAEASHRTYSNLLKTRMRGSCAWLDDNACFEAWHAGDNPFLWIHGGPGVGKSYLASKVVGDLIESQGRSVSEGLSAPVVGYFFCKVSDVKLRSVNSIMRTMIWQVASKEPEFAKIVDERRLTQDIEDTRSLWRDLLMCYLQSSLTHRKMYIIIDGFDEAYAEDQAEFLELVGQTFLDMDPQTLSRLRLALIGRENVRGLLLQYSLDKPLEIEMSSRENDEDIFNYISQGLQRSPVFQSSVKFKDEIADELYKKAEGLWVWVRLAMEPILKSRTESKIRQILKDMPRGIPEMLHHELERLSTELVASEDLIKHLNIILIWVACARKPLTLLQLRLALELHYGESILALKADLETTYSSFLKLGTQSTEEDSSSEEGSTSQEQSDIQDDLEQDDHPGLEGAEVEEETNEQEHITVLFHHASFYDFFKTSPKSAAFCVDIDAAETEIAKTLLSVLCTDEESITRDLEPLREYASVFFLSHWEQADPSLVSEYDRRVISANIVRMFTSESTILEWAVEEYELKMFTDTSWRTMFRTSEMLNDLLESNGDAGRRRAMAILRWIITPKDRSNPGSSSRQLDSGFRTNVPAQSVLETLDLEHSQELGEIFANDETPTKRLLGRVAQFFAKRWLDPAKGFAPDDWPVCSCTMLCRYQRLTGDWDPSNVPKHLPEMNDLALNVAETLAQNDFDITVSEIFQCVESVGLVQNGIWHARLAQALLSHEYHAEAIEQFLISLNQGVEPSWLAHVLLAETYAQAGEFAKAIEHQEISNERRSAEGFQDARDRNEMAEAFMRVARWQDAASMGDQAVRSAIKAWHTFDRREDEEYSLPVLCLTILVNNHERQVSQSVLRHMAKSRKLMVEGMEIQPKVMYRAFSLCRSKHGHLDFLYWFISHYDQDDEHVSPGEALYWPGLFLYETWRTEKAVAVWHKALTETPSPCLFGEGRRDFETSQSITRRRLLMFYLNNPEQADRQHLHLATNDETYYSDINLHIWGWYTRGRWRESDYEARVFLRGRVQKCVDLLSDDDPSSDIEAYIMLFKTLLVTTANDDDLRATLYLMKAWKRVPFDPISDVSKKLSQGRNTVVEEDHDGRNSSSGSSEKLRGASDAASEGDPTTIGSEVHANRGHSPATPPQDGNDTPPSAQIEDDIQSLDVKVECEGCHLSRRTWSGWHVCRFCIFMFCSECFSKLQVGDWGRQICSAKHEFFFTGSPLMAEQLVPRGKVPFGNEMMWIKDWKFALVEKWHTAAFRLDEYTTSLAQFVDDFIHDA